MDIRTILVPVADDAAARRALHAAIPLARRFGAHLTALHVRYDATMPIPYVAGPIPPDMLVELSAGAERLAQERATRLKSMVEDLFAKNGVALGEGAAVSGEWREDSGNIDFRYGTAGRVYDMAVVGHPTKADSEIMADVLEGLLFHSGRPVLMVPEDGGATIGTTVVIAWNGSREGARAVSAAMPFLAQARRIVILTVGADSEDGDGPNAQALVGSLKWHSLSAEVVITREEGLSDGETILKAAAGIGADLLVTGAYSHSRLRELIMGGVTHDLVTKATMPVLFAH